jgi:hypothetical protein
MKSLIFFIISITLVLCQRLDSPIDEHGLITLNDENFDRIVSYHSNIFIFMYAPWW